MKTYIWFMLTIFYTSCNIGSVKSSYSQFTHNSIRISQHLVSFLITYCQLTDWASLPVWQCSSVCQTNGELVFMIDDTTCLVAIYRLFRISDNFHYGRGWSRWKWRMTRQLKPNYKVSVFSSWFEYLNC